MTGFAEFVERFRTIWADPPAHLDHFLDFLHPDVRLTAPIVGSTRGRPAGLQAFRAAFAVLPDLRAEVRDWAGAGETLFIEMDFTATIGGRKVIWRNVDRFTFEGGVAVERRAFFDPFALLGAFARRPSGWRQLWRLARGRRT
jgi:hypothetical protein